MLEQIRETWCWTGLDADEVVATNRFGNLVVRARDGAFWRICPEELSCTVIATNADDFKALWANEDFEADWQMAKLVKLAEAQLGTIDEDHCFCLKLPAVLGGNYEQSNLASILRSELIRFSGRLAEQIRDVADGESISIEWPTE